MSKSGILDSYSTYVGPVDKKRFKRITSQYHKFLMHKVKEGHEVVLPEKLGSLYVLGSKQEIKFDEDGKVTGLAPDWVGTKKLWDTNLEAKKNKKLLYHMNLDTDGIRYRYLWSKNRVIVENKTLYSLVLTRDNKRTLHSLIKSGKQYKTK